MIIIWTATADGQMTLNSHIIGLMTLMFVWHTFKLFCIFYSFCLQAKTAKKRATKSVKKEDKGGSAKKKVKKEGKDVKAEKEVNICHFACSPLYKFSLYMYVASYCTLSF